MVDYKKKTASLLLVLNKSLINQTKPNQTISFGLVWFGLVWRFAIFCKIANRLAQLHTARLVKLVNTTDLKFVPLRLSVQVR